MLSSIYIDNFVEDILDHIHIIRKAENDNISKNKQENLLNRDNKIFKDNEDFDDTIETLISNISLNEYDNNDLTLEKHNNNFNKNDTICKDKKKFAI